MFRARISLISFDKFMKLVSEEINNPEVEFHTEIDGGGFARYVRSTHNVSYSDKYIRYDTMLEHVQTAIATEGVSIVDSLMHYINLITLHQLNPEPTADVSTDTMSMYSSLVNQ